MDFLARAIADLASIVTFQQRRPPAPVSESEEWQMARKRPEPPPTPGPEVEAAL